MLCFNSHQLEQGYPLRLLTHLFLHLLASQGDFFVLTLWLAFGFVDVSC